MKRFPVLLSLFCVLTFGLPSHAQFDNVGTIDFPTSAGGEAQEHFLRGVAILHSFGWKQAVEQFQAAQALDPDFAMAYWGETLSYNHWLFPEENADSPRQALQRLGATRAQRLVKAPTAREKGLLDAVERLWDDGTWQDRRVAYMNAMAELHTQYPDDDEIATFYALSMLSGARAMGDDSLRLEMQAGAIALGIFNRNPTHPGAAHFVIHSFDDPLHAPIALQAAYAFADIAPAVSHARHMPTHIFIQHGMWDLVSNNNESAYQAAIDLWEPGDSVTDGVHALDWGHYGDLQRGDYERAGLWVERLESLIEISDGQARAVNTLPMLEARYIAETEQWQTAEITADTSPHTLLATGLSAVRMANLALASEAEEALGRLATADSYAGALRGESLWVPVMHKEIGALIRAAQGNASDAITLMDEALEIVATLRPPNGAANPVKPTYELYGEILLELDRPEDAIAKFETSLIRMPNRPRSLLGLAQAYERTGNAEGAATQYRKLSGIWDGRESLTGLQEARQYLQ
jgi:tetratricopeptide (TPR) repeat protein